MPNPLNWNLTVSAVWRYREIEIGFQFQPHSRIQFRFRSSFILQPPKRVSCTPKSSAVPALLLLLYSLPQPLALHRRLLPQVAPLLTLPAPCEDASWIKTMLRFPALLFRWPPAGVSPGQP